ncbi:MAG: hypothetical protein KAJ00_00065, partial [Deltaproteobacteria bacterium]|nr:hypothetical protein [Deltaproteobacteria bacterium]
MEKSIKDSTLKARETLMIKKYFLAFTSLIFLLFAHNVFSDDGMGSIKMIVNDFYTDEPVEGAEILITPCDYIGTT